MCGIAGFLGSGYSPDLVPSMIDIMRHRGPDATGFYTSDLVHLGHCRLSINDLSDNGRQPFVDETRSVAAIVNGEIYNYQPIRKDLINRGYRFRSNSDSEIVLNGYLEFGNDLFPKLNGMFAVAIWDDKKGKLLLARDRLGIKPLYYSTTNQYFIFASEIKALARCKNIPLTLDHQSFVEYLAYGNYFSNRCMNNSVKIVLPGEMVCVDVHNFAVNRRRFWRASLDDSNLMPLDNVYDRYFATLERSVRRHLISDVPVGCYLSSGIDSTSVAYCAAEKLPETAINSYTGNFGMTGFYDETKEAGQIATAIGCNRNIVKITPQDFIDNIEKVAWHLDEPRVGMGSFSQFMVAKAASRDVKVILTGHGGDEFFAGYPVFKTVHGLKGMFKLLRNSSWRELLFALYFLYYPLVRKEAAYFLPNIFSRNAMNSLLKNDYLIANQSSVQLFQELENLNSQCGSEYERLTLTYLNLFLPSLFIVEDKISMAFSLESRTPLCDNEMLDLACSIPLSQKLSGLELKHIPRTAMRGKLPDFLFDLPKKGFPTPLKYWFKNELKTFVREVILDNVGLLYMFDPNKIERLIRRYQEKRVASPFDEIDAYKIWVILNLIFYFNQQKMRYAR